jgi:3-oxoacyl-[acyl-carrier protein] reductase
MTLKGKTAIVTGGGRDIGLACVMRLAEEGANVAINYFASSEGADKAVADIKAAGGNAFAMQGDLMKMADCEALVAKTVAEFGDIHVLVNNAGGLVGRHTVAEMTLEHYDTVMDLNFKSVFMMVKACSGHLKEGSIINMASQAGHDGGGPGATIYGASKGALQSFTRGLAKELAPNIRVNAINPGMIDTDFHNIFSKPEGRKNVAAATPLKREGRPMEVADLVAYLASEKSSFINGNNIDINGGLAFS